MPYIENTEPDMKVLVDIQEQVLDPTTTPDNLQGIAIMLLELAEKDMRLAATMKRQIASYEALCDKQDKVIETQNKLLSYE